MPVTINEAPDQEVRLPSVLRPNVDSVALNLMGSGRYGTTNQATYNLDGSLRGDVSDKIRRLFPGSFTNEEN